MNITEQDRDMGAASVLTYGPDGPRVDGYRLLSYSVAKSEAYTEVGLPSPFVGYWSLTSDQLNELLDKAPGRQLAAERCAPVEAAS